MLSKSPAGYTAAVWNGTLTKQQTKENECQMRLMHQQGRRCLAFKKTGDQDHIFFPLTSNKALTCVARDICYKNFYYYTYHTYLYYLYINCSKLSKTKQKAKTALMHLAFPIHTNQNAYQQPAYRVQCALPPQPFSRHSLLIFQGSGFETRHIAGLEQTKPLLWPSVYYLATT